MTSNRTVAALLLSLAAASPCWAAKDTFTATQVSHQASEEDFFTGLAMNKRAQVLASATLEDYAWWITGRNGSRLVNQFEWPRVQAMVGLNDAGQAIGTYLAIDGSPHAFVTDPDGNLIDANPAGASTSFGEAIDSRGRIVVRQTTGGISSLAVSNATRTAFRTLDTQGLAADATAMKAGRIVGSLTLGSGDVHGFVLREKSNTIIDLGTFGGTRSGAFGVNASHLVVGYATDGAGVEQAFITGADGVTLLRLADLGPSRGFAGDSIAYGVNGDGFVVGTAQRKRNDTFYVLNAFISRPGGRGMHNLNSLVNLPLSELAAAKAINDRGQILVESAADEGPLWLLTPTRATWREEIDADDE